MHCAAEGGHIEIIKFLLPLFGALKVYEKDRNACSMLHWAAHMGHCQVARYLIDELHMNPQDRNMVCGVLGDCVGFNVQGLDVIHVYVCVSLCSML